MQPYTILPLLACLAAAAASAAVLTRAPGERVNQLMAAMLACAAHWAACEVIWNNLDDPVWVLRTIRISCLGWIPLGPLLLHLVLEAQDDMTSRLRRSLPFFYASALVAQIVYLTNDAALAGVKPTEWGWTYRFGSMYLIVFAPTVTAAVLGVARWQAGIGGTTSALEKRQTRQALLAMLFSLVVAVVTDVLLPQLGVRAPRLGSASVAVFCGILAHGVTRHDFFVLAPGVLATRILESLHEGAALLSGSLRVEVANEALARQVGISREALLGSELRSFLPDLPQGSGEFDVYETDLITVNGASVPVAISSAALHDKAGRALGCVISVRDLQDVAAMRDRVVTAGRLAAVGELAAGVVHEISSPTAWMRANLSCLRGMWSDLGERLSTTPVAAEVKEVLTEGGELIDESIDGVERIVRIVSSVRSFSHAGMGERESTAVNGLLESAIAMAEPKLRSLDVDVVLELGDVPPVLCRPQDLKQLFLNLLINAANAVDRGQIRVRTESAGGLLTISIEDDGCGMPPQQVRGLFDPVVESHRAEGGFAIGLPACHEIVRKHGGEIEVDSSVEGGSKFSVILPVAPFES